MGSFPIPGVNDTGDMFELFRFINNQATEGLFFPVIILTIWMVAFIGSVSEGRNVMRAFMFASFISVVLGFLAVIMDFMNVSYIYFMILIIAFALAGLKLLKARND